MTRALGGVRNRGERCPAESRLFQRIYTRLGCEGRPPHFVVEYHPYADLTHTIRLREDTAHVRLSDVLGYAPRAVVEAAAAILLGPLVPPPPAGRTGRNVSPIFLRAIHASPPVAACASAGPAEIEHEPSRRAPRPRADVRAIESARISKVRCPGRVWDGARAFGARNWGVLIRR